MKDINLIRESEKDGLAQYLEDYDFVDFEKTVGKTIKTLEDKLENLSNEIDKSADEASREEFYNDAFYISNDMYSIEEELFLIYELVILNDYKEYENVLKGLLKITLDFKNSDLNRHDVIKSRLESKKIDVTKFINYKAVNELRNVNNHIEHSSILNKPKDLNYIAEFKKKSTLNYIDLRNFHERIFKARVSYIFELKNKIYEYLYEFDRNRISSFANSIAKRLNEKEIDILIAKLENLK